MHGTRVTWVATIASLPGRAGGQMCAVDMQVAFKRLQTLFVAKAGSHLAVSPHFLC